MKQELIDYFGIEIPEDKTIDDLEIKDIKSQINKKFVPINQLKDRKDILDPFLSESWAGKMKGIESKLVSTMKNELGLDVTHSDFDGMNFEEKLGKLTGLVKENIDSLGKKKPEADKELVEKLQRYETENQKFKSELEKKIEEFNSYKNEVSEKERTSKIRSFETELFNSVKYPAGTKDAMKKGLNAMFKEQYALIPDENGNFELHSKKDNTRVYNPDKPTEPLSPQEAVKRLAKENDLWTDSPHDGKESSKKTGGKYVSQFNKDNGDDDGARKRKPNPAFLRQTSR